MSVRVEHGDCRDVIKSLADCSLDACVTDPPYALVSIVKRFANSPRSERTENTENPYGRTGRGFMGQRWDTGETAFSPDFWSEICRVLKPGAHLAAFGGTRTFHRMAVAIEDAGFEIRDTLSWLYGSGFPKSHNAGNGWGTALKPAWEPIVLARKPLAGTVAANVREHGTGAINIDDTRIGAEERVNLSASANRIYGQFKGAETEGRTATGRWPANVLHDGSEEVLEAFAAYPTHGAGAAREEPGGGTYDGSTGIGFAKNGSGIGVGLRGFRIGDSGSAARFFFSGKADADDRIGSKHPTVKPVALMRWLVRLVTPKGGLVLDPFAGTGTTGVACIREGMDAILIEREAEYHADIQRRLAMLSGLDTPLLAGAAE